MSFFPERWKINKIFLKSVSNAQAYQNEIFPERSKTLDSEEPTYQVIKEKCPVVFLGRFLTILSSCLEALITEDWWHRFPVKCFRVALIYAYTIYNLLYTTNISLNMVDQLWVTYSQLWERHPGSFPACFMIPTCRRKKKLRLI